MAEPDLFDITAKTKRVDPVLRFWPKVRLGETCWEWMGAITKEGYGWFKSHPSSITAHRMSWQIHFGEIPKGLCVLHKCDNRKCVRPDHLFLGSLADNILDAVRKKRHAFGIRHAFATLLEQDVHDIRMLYWNYNAAQKDLARGFGTTQPHISGIVNFKLRRLA